MAAPIDFYFDFSSPYGYLASLKIDEIAARHQRAVNWQPHLIGVAFKLTNARPLAEMPIKSDYVKLDWPRFARLLGSPFKLPEPFPFLAVNASRAFYWLQTRDPGLAVKFAKAAYHKAFGEGRNISSADEVAAIGESLGVARADLLKGINDPAIKDGLRQKVDAAIAAGVFGSPYIVIDGEPFWGADRLDQIDKWLATGGW
jgi:2-hydroxychromene-2-carboxylate isomerase